MVWKITNRHADEKKIHSLVLQWDHLTEFHTANNEFKDQQKNDSNGSHCVYNLPDIPDHHDAWITTDGQTTLAGLSEG